MQKMQVWSLGWEDPLEQGMTTYSSILAWKTPWTGAWRATVHGVAKSQAQLKQLSMHSWSTPTRDYSSVSEMEMTSQNKWLGYSRVQTKQRLKYNYCDTINQLKLQLRGLTFRWGIKHVTTKTENIKRQNFVGEKWKILLAGRIYWWK